MTFPVIATSNNGGAAVGTSDVTVNLPASIASGDLCIVIVGISISSGTITAPAGWTAFTNISSVSMGLGISQTVTAMYRICDGSEGSSITIARGSSCFVFYVSLRITGWHGTTAPEAPAPNAVGGGTNPNPPSCTASWGSADNLWIAVALRKITTTLATTLPSGYGGQVTAYSGSNYGRMDSGTNNVTAATEDPGAFGNGGSGGFGITIAVRPSAGGAGVTLQQVERGRALGRGLGRGL